MSEFIPCPCGDWVPQRATQAALGPGLRLGPGGQAPQPVKHRNSLLLFIQHHLPTATTDIHPVCLTDKMPEALLTTACVLNLFSLDFLRKDPK